MNKELRWIVFLLLAGCSIAAFAFQQKTEPSAEVIDVNKLFGQPHDWLRIEHESGAEYIIRSDAVIGFMESSGRNEILISGSAPVRTNLTIEEFVAMGEQYRELARKREAGK